jgi:hypothetical protein
MNVTPDRAKSWTLATAAMICQVPVPENFSVNDSLISQLDYSFTNYSFR